MEFWSRFADFTALDAVAVSLLVTSWLVLGLTIEKGLGARASVSMLMADYRREWMAQMVTRDPRVFDAIALGSLRQGVSFFASATMIALGGGAALLGNTEQLIGLANDLTISQDPQVVWEIKLLLVLIFLSNAFFKFVWSHRLFGYCQVVAAAVPNEIDDPAALPRARKAGELNVTAARSFNRGLRAVYFALTAAAWMLGPEALIGATLFTVAVLLRREFGSKSREVLVGPEEGA